MSEVSVVATTYMHGRYIRASMESVLGQTFRDFELILIDDESPDNTEEEVAKVKDERIKYIRQKRTGLPAISRNRGIRMARGQLIAFLDGDDIWYPHKLEQCYEVFQKHPQVDLVCHNELMRRDDETKVKSLSYGPYVPDMFRRLLFKGNCLSTSATVVRRRALQEGEFLFREDQEFFTAEDYDLWLRLAKKYKFYFIPEVLGEYLIHDWNASAGLKHHYHSQVAVLKRNFKEYREKRGADQFLLNMRICWIYGGMVKQFIKVHKFQQALKYLLKAFMQVLKYEK